MLLYLVNITIDFTSLHFEKQIGLSVIRSRIPSTIKIPIKISV